MTVVIETARLLLRPLSRSDLPALVRALNNLNVSKMTAQIPHPYGMNDAEEYFARCQAAEDGTLRLSIALRQAPLELIGGIGHEMNELGYWIAESHWGKGYASEAAAAFLGHAFAASTLEMVFARYRNDNPASARVLEKLGFAKREETTCRSIAAAGTFPATRVELTRAAWAGRQS